MAKKKILYVTPVWSGLQSFVFEGKNEFHGMPAFNNVFRTLLNDPEVELHVFVFLKDKSKRIRIPEAFSGQLQISSMPIPAGSTAVIAYLKAVLKVRSIILQWQPSVVFGHGSVGAIGGLAAKWTKRPFVQRIYGTFLINELNEPKWKLFARHPLEYLSFSLIKKATVITNDGTHGDRVFNKLNHHQDELKFWINGYNPSVKEVPAHQSREPYIVYVARLDYWKRQHLLIEALGELKKQGKVINAKIVGQTISEDFLQDLRKRIANYGLEEQVELVGGVSANEAIALIKGAVLSCSLYHTSNLGNVFIESLLVGTPVLAINCNESLSVVPEDCYLNTTEDPMSIANQISFAMDHKDEMISMSDRAMAFVKNSLLTWSQRVEKEIKILFD